MIELEGVDVVKYLNGRDTVRDGTLVGFSVRDLNLASVIDLIFERRAGRTVKLELRDVQEFDYTYARGNHPDQIEMLKCIMTDTGDFYMSLDPYDEREAFVSEKDNDYFRSKFVRLTMQDPK